MARIPTELRTERLLLRQWRDEDAEPLAAIYRQPGYLAHMPAHDLDETRAQVARFRQRWEEDGLCQWAAETLADGRFVGRLGLLRHHDWPPEPDPVEVGWVLDQAVWGRGLATEAGRASVAVWREHLPADRRLISITTPANHRSRAVMTRLGMTERGSTRWHGYDVIWCALDREPGGDGP